MATEAQEGLVEVDVVCDRGLTDHCEVGKAGKEGSGRDRAASKEAQEGLAEVEGVHDRGLTDHDEVGEAGKEGSGRDRAASKEGFHCH